MAQGIILAAGFSSRAKGNKMMFEIDHMSLIEHAIKHMKPFVSQIFVITGYYEKELTSKLAHDKEVSLIYNVNYEQGMFSSIQAGVFVVDEDFFILPGDCPFVGRETFEALLHGEKMIRVPSYQHQRGHPIWFDLSLKPALLREPESSNLKAFRNQYDFETIDVLDPHILDDIDTISDFNKIAMEDK